MMVELSAKEVYLAVDVELVVAVEVEAVDVEAVEVNAVEVVVLQTKTVSLVRVIIRTKRKNKKEWNTG